MIKRTPTSTAHARRRPGRLARSQGWSTKRRSGTGTPAQIRRRIKRMHAVPLAGFAGVPQPGQTLTGSSQRPMVAFVGPFAVVHQQKPVAKTICGKLFWAAVLIAVCGAPLWVTLI